MLLLGAGCVSPDPGLKARDAEAIPVDEIQDPTPPDEPPVDPVLPGSDPTEVPTTDETGPFDPAPPDTEVALPEIPAGQFPLDPDKPPQPYDAYLIAALDDIQAFWREQMPAVYGTDYQDLTGGIWPAYPGKRGMPGCGSQETTYRDVEGNAFYCQDGDFVIYDDSFLLPQLDQDPGRAVIGVVLAHEWGHAIQARLGLFDGSLPTTTVELQADCFAGAWTAHLAAGENPALPFGDADIQVGLAGMITVADQPGTTNENSFQAHGSAIARVGSFQEGFRFGVSRCADYPQNQPDPLQFSYRNVSTQEELAAAENAPYENSADPENEGIFQLIQRSLEAFWPAVLQGTATFTVPALVAYPNEGPYPPCDGVADNQYPKNVFFCASTSQVMYDDSLARDLYDNIGDFSIGYLVANGWSDAVQAALGSQLGGERRALLNDCLTGAWVRSTLPNDNLDPNDPETKNRVTASPGDLDEAVRTAVIVGDESTDLNQIGSAFEKIEALRTGLLGDLAACNETYAKGGG